MAALFFVGEVFIKTKVKLRCSEVFVRAKVKFAQMRKDGKFFSITLPIGKTSFPQGGNFTIRRITSLTQTGELHYACFS